MTYSCPHSPLRFYKGEKGEKVFINLFIVVTFVFTTNGKGCKSNLELG